MRTLPAVSEPSAKSNSPAATPAAEPQEEPPGTRSGQAGLVGMPYQRFSPVSPAASSTVMVLPTIAAPASVSIVTQGAVMAAGAWVRAQSGLPKVETWPATSNRSFSPKPRPARGPEAAPGRVTRGPGMKAPTGSWGSVISRGPLCRFRCRRHCSAAGAGG